MEIQVDEPEKRRKIVICDMPGRGTEVILEMLE